MLRPVDIQNNCSYFIKSEKKTIRIISLEDVNELRGEDGLISDGSV